MFLEAASGILDFSFAKALIASAAFFFCSKRFRDKSVDRGLYNNEIETRNRKSS
jgi:hypothetical protein